MSWLDGAAARLRFFFARRASEVRFDEELRFHVDMETQRLIRELSLDPAEARRRALIGLGGKEKHREALRDGRGAPWLNGLGLDLKLGLRMLVKYPGLSFVGVFGMATAVVIGALAFSAVQTVTSTTLPFDEGARVVAIQNIDLRRSDGGRGTQLHDFAVWRDGLRSVEDLSAYRIVMRTVASQGVSPLSLRVAEMTASGFRVTRTAPLLGRYLMPDDARAGAAAVAVLGYDLWQRQFGGRTDIIGTAVQVAGVHHTIVGVMPSGFAFPVSNQLWIPLRLTPSDYEPGAAPGVEVFGRLAAGASLADARVQLEAIGRRLASTDSATYGHMRPRILPYARSFLDSPQLDWALHLGQVAVSLLLVVVAVNVGVLVYARTATRAGEFAVRTALGASRRRIVTQLFAEALVLSATAAIVGIIATHFVSTRIDAMVRQSAGDQVPYWMHLDVTPSTVLYIGGLTILAAVIVGVVPTLRATRGGVSDNLKLSSRGATFGLGRTWTALLVAQVAISVAAIPIAIFSASMGMKMTVLDRGTPATKSVVMVTPMLDDDNAATDTSAAASAARQQRYLARVDELVRRLENEAHFDVIRMSDDPGSDASTKIEIDTVPSAAPSDTVARSLTAWPAINRVDDRFFTAFNIRLLSGRTFSREDYLSVSPSVIVNRYFVSRYLGQRNPLGRRLRIVAAGKAGRDATPPATQPWLQIVGVVADFPVSLPTVGNASRVYVPLRPAEVYPLRLAVRARAIHDGTAAARIREIGLSVDPKLRYLPIRSLDDLLNSAVKGEQMAFFGILLTTLSVVLLSAAGIFALMSFTVTLRRREIGIRSALGAPRSRVLAGVLSRAARQIGIGIAVGAIGMFAAGRLTGDHEVFGSIRVMLGVAALMSVVALLAAVGPARRALRVNPTEALRAE